MRKQVEREYVLTVDETKAAFWAYLKDQDQPVPENPGGLTIKWNAEAEAFVSWSYIGD